METLQIGGVSARQLADDFGTPLYVYDEDKIIAQAKDAMAFASILYSVGRKPTVNKIRISASRTPCRQWSFCAYL